MVTQTQQRSAAVRPAAKLAAGAPKPQAPKPTTGSRTGPLDLYEVVDWFKGDHFRNLLKKPDQSQQAIKALDAFVAMDSTIEFTMAAAGEIYYNILLQPLDVQKQFIFAICDQRKVPHPSYQEGPATRGRQESGRNQLVHALYYGRRSARGEDMMELRPGSRDTRAGKRVSSYIRVYKQLNGLIQPRQPVQAGQARTAGALFVALFAVAEQDETDILIELANRAVQAGLITQDNVNKWIRSAEANAENVEPEAEPESEATSEEEVAEQPAA